MGFLHTKKKTTSASASSNTSSRDRFNEKKSYENLTDEYNKTSKSKKKSSHEDKTDATPVEARDEEQASRSEGNKQAKKSTGLTLLPASKTSKSEKELDAVVADAGGKKSKSPIKEINPRIKKKSKHRSRRRELSESESEDSFSSVSSSASESDEETDLSCEESFTDDEVSETSTNLESFDTMDDSKADPDHQAIVQVNEHGNVEKLRLEVLRLFPKASSPRQVVIKVDASSITLQDCMIRRGKWYDMQSLPFVPGSDLVGTIHEIGSEAVRAGGFKVGDRVAAVVPAGGNAKYITLNYDQIIRVPEGVDPVVALSLSSTYVPAREALDLARKMNTPFTGANILVIGGNGPSGLATIELAGLEGANVFTTADERHHEFLAGLGAKCFPIDPKKWLPTLKGKMDVVIDSVCLDGFESSALALNDEGVLVCTGMSALYTQGNIPAFGFRDVRDMKAFYVKLRAKYLMRSIAYDKMERFTNAPNEYAQHFRYLCHLATKETIKPIISARASLNMVAFMHRAIEHGDTPHGVCVCTPWITKNDL
ncbi:hypothetical protein ACHAXN_007321 [Cyclotella atomus]